MTTIIHCNHCQEDMNTADWEANNGECLHCGHEVESDWDLWQQKRNPLASAKQRIEISRFLRSTPVYV